jgi:hypothetical protein
LHLVPYLTLELNSQENVIKNRKTTRLNRYLNRFLSSKYKLNNTYTSKMIQFYDFILGWQTEPESGALACRHVLQRHREEEDPPAGIPLQRRGPLLVGHLAKQRPVRCNLDEQGSGKPY